MGRKPKNLKRTADDANLEVPAFADPKPAANAPMQAAPAIIPPYRAAPAPPSTNNNIFTNNHLPVPSFHHSPTSVPHPTLHHQRSWHFESSSSASVLSPAKSTDFNLQELPPLGTVQPTLAEIVSPVFWDSHSSSNSSTLPSCPGTGESRSSSLPLERPAFPPDMGPSDVLMKL